MEEKDYWVDPEAERTASSWRCHRRIRGGMPRPLLRFVIGLATISVIGSGSPGGTRKAFDLQVRLRSEMNTHLRE
jgi:hypothetical protein